MDFLVIENLDEWDQFIIRLDFVRISEKTTNHSNGLIKIKNPNRNYVKRPINRLKLNENIMLFFRQKVKITP